MGFPPRGQEVKAGPELAVKLVGGVARYLETAAPGGTVLRKGGHENMPPWPHGAADLANVALPVLGLCEEMEDGPIMPDIEAGQGNLGSEDVGLNPSDQRSGVSEPVPGLRQGGTRNVQDRDMPVTRRQEVVDKRRSTSTDIEDGRPTVRSRCSNELQRNPWLGLVPA